MKLNPLTLILISLVAVSFSGCDPDYVGGLESTEVVGKVTLDGHPVEGAQVIFIPMKYKDAAGQPTALSYAVTDAEGKFELAKANGDAGAVVGRHRVLISKLSSRENIDVEEMMKASEAEEDAKKRPVRSVLGINGQPENELIPAMYNIRSILTCEVDSSLGRVRPDFDLTTIDPMLLEDR